MKWTEIELYGVLPLRPRGEKIVPFQFRGERIGTLERRESADRIDGLAVHCDTGAHLELQAAVDVSEQLKRPRVFVIEGKPRDAFMLFGGEKAYWITSGGAVKSDLPLFRKSGEEEYWTTRILEEGSSLIIVYEAGVLAIDATLHVRWHKPKLLNDDFVAVERDVLKFVSEGQREWLMRLEDGTRQ